MQQTTQRKSRQKSKTIRPSVILISAPGFASGWSPLGIARIKAFLIDKGYNVTNLPLCVYFTDFIERRYPTLISIDKEIGEFGRDWHEMYFSGLIFGRNKPEVLIKQTVKDMHENTDIYRTQLYFDGNKKLKADPKEVDKESKKILRYCKIMHRFLIDKINNINWEEYDIIGFSCLEAQFLTSIFLARRIREMSRKKQTSVFGGALFQSYNALDLKNSFDVIDHIIVGEGEHALLQLINDSEGLNSSKKNNYVANIADTYFEDEARLYTMETYKYPHPNYDELKYAKVRNYSLTTYMGRGCSHGNCSFCAIKKKGQKNRNAQEIFEEIRHLVRFHREKKIYFGDWEINGNQALLEEVCDLLIANRIELNSWAEINARNTSPILLRKMKRAGISNVQIGIESFSANILKNINKPATVLDNIKVLKWGIEAGMSTIYFNILCNHPLTRKQDVEESYKVIKDISHLIRPPVKMILNEMELYRTSNMYSRSDQYGIVNIRDYRFYKRAYPQAALKTEVPMFNLEYRKHEVHLYWKRIENFLQGVKSSPTRLTARKLKEGILIYDTRTRNIKRFRIKGLDAYVISEMMDKIVTQNDLAIKLEVPEDKILESIRRLQKARLIVRYRNQCLSLPVRV